jgi:hypothetical protein
MGSKHSHKLHASTRISCGRDIHSSKSTTGILASLYMAYVWGHASVLSYENLIFAPFRGTLRPLTDLVWSSCLSELGLFVVFGVSLFCQAQFLLQSSR